jgi:hypothetical protein
MTHDEPTFIPSQRSTAWLCTTHLLLHAITADRTRHLALGTAGIALRQDPDATADDVRDIALAEFGIVLAPQAAADALASRRRDLTGST